MKGTDFTQADLEAAITQTAEPTVTFSAPLHRKIAPCSRCGRTRLLIIDAQGAYFCAPTLTTVDGVEEIEDDPTCVRRWDAFKRNHPHPEIVPT